MQQGSLAGKAAAGMVWLALQSVAARAVIFISQIILAQLLLPQDFGTIALASTITTIAGVLVGFGVDDVLLQRQKSFHVWEGPAFWISMGFATLGGLMVLLLSPLSAIVYRQPQLLGVLSILALAMPLSALTTVSTVRLRASLNFRMLAVFGTLEAIGTQVLTVVLAEHHFGVYSFVLPVPALVIVRTIAFWRVAGLPSLRIPAQFRKRQWRILFGRSTAVFGSKLLTGIISQADYIILGFLATGYVVGLYYFAFRLSSQSLRVLAGNVNSVLFPTLTQLNTDPRRQETAAVRSARVLAFAAMPLCFLQAALAEPVMTLFFDHNWQPSILLVQILSLGFPFDAPAWVAGALLTAKGQFRRALLFSVIGGISFTALIALGASYDGAVGVAVAVSLYYLVYGPAYTYAALRNSPDVGRLMIDTFLVAPALSALTFGAGTLAAQALGGSGHHILRAMIICLVGAPSYLLVLRWLQPAVYEDTSRRVYGLLFRFRPSDANQPGSA